MQQNHVHSYLPLYAAPLTNKYKWNSVSKSVGKKSMMIEQIGWMILMDGNLLNGCWYIPPAEGASMIQLLANALRRPPLSWACYQRWVGWWVPHKHWNWLKLAALSLPNNPAYVGDIRLVAYFHIKSVNLEYFGFENEQNSWFANSLTSWCVPLCLCPLASFVELTVPLRSFRDLVRVRFGIWQGRKCFVKPMQHRLA